MDVDDPASLCPDGFTLSFWFKRRPQYMGSGDWMNVIAIEGNGVDIGVYSRKDNLDNWRVSN